MRPGDVAAGVGDLQAQRLRLGVGARVPERLEQLAPLRLGVVEPVLGGDVEVGDVDGALVERLDVADLGQAVDRLVEIAGRDDELQRSARVVAGRADVRGGDDAVEVARDRDRLVGDIVDVLRRRGQRERDVAVDLAVLGAGEIGPCPAPIE